MQIEFIKSAITLYGKVEKGDILNVSEQSALAFIQAGFAKTASKKAVTKAKKMPPPAVEDEKDSSGPEKENA